MARIIDTERLKAYHREILGLFTRKSEIVNDLTTGGTNVPLSAEMGKQINREMGGSLAPVTVSLAAGANHSSSKDMISVPVNAGERYIITLSMTGEVTAGITVLISELDANGENSLTKATLNTIETSNSLVEGRRMTFTATYDNPIIAVYINNNTQNAHTFSWVIEFGNIKMISEIQNEIENISETIEQINGKIGGSVTPVVVSLAAGAQHSSTLDRRSLPINAGETYILKPSVSAELTSGNTPFEIRECDASGGNAISKKTLHFIDGSALEFKATYDNPLIGVYIRNYEQDTITFSWSIEYGNSKVIEKIQEDIVDLNEKIENYESATDIDTETRGKQFAALYGGKNDVEAFVFFTDPHAMGGNDNFTDAQKTRFNTLLRYITSYHKTIPSSFVLCGGDWLNNGDTKAVATWKLGLINKYRTSMNIKQVVGNHDYNYQGYQGNYSKLTAKQVARLLCIDEGKTYYFFDTQLTRYFVLDTEIDDDASVNGMSNYKWEQIDWLANQLLANEKGHVVIAMHMYRQSPTKPILAMSNNLQALLAAFNSRETIILNEQTYDFSDCTGKVAYIICGHTHVDTIYTEAEIPVVTTKHVETNFDFDLVCCDYTNGKLYLLRALGNSEAREVDIIV